MKDTHNKRASRNGGPFLILFIHLTCLLLPDADLDKGDRMCCLPSVRYPQYAPQ